MSSLQTLENGKPLKEAKGEQTYSASFIEVCRNVNCSESENMIADLCTVVRYVLSF